MASRSPLRKITDSEFDSDPPAEIAGLLEATHFGHLRRSVGARGIQTGRNRHEDDRTRRSARHLARGPGRRLRRPARMQRKPRLPNAFRHRSANQRRGSRWLLKHPDPQLAEDGHGPLSVSDRSACRTTPLLAAAGLTGGGIALLSLSRLEPLAIALTIAGVAGLLWSRRSSRTSGCGATGGCNGTTENQITPCGCANR